MFGWGKNQYGNPPLEFQAGAKISQSSSDAQANKIFKFENRLAIMSKKIQELSNRLIVQYPSEISSVKTTNQAHAPGQIPIQKEDNVIPVNRFQAMETALENEAYDPEWGSVTENRIAEQFAYLADYGSSISSTQCKTTICRIEVFHKNSDYARRFIREFSLKLGWQSSASSIKLVDNGSGQFITKIWVKRKAPMHES